ncbi:MAG: pilus assembly protein PilO [Cyanobacteriota bacterium]
MTVGGDYIPGEDYGALEEPNYPVVFGMRLTPRVNGILLALAGLLGAAYLLFNVVLPKWEENAALRADIAAKEQQLVDQGQAQQQIEAARAKLAEAEQLRADVLALFADEEGLDTLLIDVNERVQAANARITDPERRATLSKFELVPPPAGPDGQPSDLVTDGSLGVAVNNKLRQRLYNVEMEGSFAQAQSVIRNIERLQPLLVLRNFTSTPTDPPTLRLNQQGRPLPNQDVEPRLRTSFQVQALMPAPIQPPAPPAPPADPNAPPADPNAPAQ